MITYFDTSVLLKLVVDDETGIAAAHELWMTGDVAVSAELATSRVARRLRPRFAPGDWTWRATDQHAKNPMGSGDNSKSSR